MSADFLSTLLAANIAASAAIFVVILIRKPVRQMIGARLSYWLWLIPVLAGLATLLPARDAGSVPAPAAPIQPIAEATVQFATAWTAPQAASPAQAGFDLALMIAILWVAGVVAFLGLMLLQQQRTLRTLKLGPAGARTANNFGPAVVGVLKPFLVVPADFEQRFSPSERALVLAHEDVHLAAGHTRINAVLVVLTSLNWFNPLVHLAAKLARDDQELACDATVLERFPRQRGVYAEALLKTQISATPLPLGCTWPSRSSSFFKERLTMLANKAPSRARRMAGAGFVALALLGAGFAAWAQKPSVPVMPVASGSVSIDKDGYVIWNGKAADTMEALTEAAKNQVASGSLSLSMAVNTQTQYIKVQPVIQAAQKAGMKDITFLPSGVTFVTPTPPPPGTPPPPKDTPDPVRLFVDFDGGTYWNGVFVDGPSLEQNLKSIPSINLIKAGVRSAPPELHIEPHMLVPFADMERVLAAAKKTGVVKTAILGGGPKPSPGYAPAILAGEIR